MKLRHLTQIDDLCGVSPVDFDLRKSELIRISYSANFFPAPQPLNKGQIQKELDIEIDRPPLCIVSQDASQGQIID